MKRKNVPVYSLEEKEGFKMRIEKSIEEFLKD